ncbi:unnamed protein product [Urochloa humidicola]
MLSGSKGYGGNAVVDPGWEDLFLRPSRWSTVIGFQAVADLVLRPDVFFLARSKEDGSFEGRAEGKNMMQAVEFEFHGTKTFVMFTILLLENFD